MLKTPAIIAFLALAIFSFSAAAQPESDRYISVDQVKPGMEAYCLTVYKGTQIEKFELEVLDVVYNYQPGKNAILVIGKDPRFEHTGPVAGCSGSPVYIDGRLAGALAFGWNYSKDPLYGVTPIHEMLRAGSSNPKAGNNPGTIELGIDFSKPIDFKVIQNKLTLAGQNTVNNSTSATPLLCPLVTPQLPAAAQQFMADQLKPFGFLAVPGSNGANHKTVDHNVKLENGSCLALPLVIGDIEMTAMGTVTEVVGNKVYGFGHSFLGQGPIDVPMATGKIHTIVSNLASSFKYGHALQVVGALRADESTAVFGQIGATAEMIPLTVKINRFNDEPRTYNCQIASHKQLTPTLLASALNGAANMLGSIPSDNTITYKAAVSLDNGQTINLENTSVNGLSDIFSETIGSVTLLMNNPFKEAKPVSFDFQVDIQNKKELSGIWTASVSQSQVKPGDSINISVVTSSVLADKKLHQFTLDIPKNLKPGKYNLMIAGGEQYLEFLRQAKPQDFTANNFSSLVKALNDMLAVKRNKLHCLLSLPAEGLMLEKAELPNLPGTKTLILADSKRTLQAKPYPRWIETSKTLDSVVAGQKVIQIEVKK